MSLNKFGHHLGRRLGRIYLIERGINQNEIRRLIQEEMKKYDLLSPKDLDDVVGRRHSLLYHQLQLSMQDNIKDALKEVRQLCSEEDAKLRCTLYYPFTASGGVDATYYVINDSDTYIELWMKCTILDVRVDTSFTDFQIQYNQRSRLISTAIDKLKGMSLRKGARIYIVRNPNIVSFSGSLTLEYMPWK